MRKRQQKKNAREHCPKCGRMSPVVRWKKLKSGRWVSEHVMCFSCDVSTKPQKVYTSSERVDETGNNEHEGK